MRFGTDGVRGVANSELTPDFSLRLGRAAAQVLAGDRWLVARDPRQSGPMIEAGLAAGLASAGVDVELLGVMPTPAVAWIAANEGVPAAMISASHNPAADNGIKLFAAGGTKLADEVQTKIELSLDAHHRRASDGLRAVATAPLGAEVGTIDRRPEGIAGYTDAVVASVADVDRLDRLRVVIDCANGAASNVAPGVLARLGVDTVTINDQPDGMNINDRCGSTHLDVLAKAVIAERADVGFAFDGDADRVLAVDAAGNHLDGDQLMALLAIDARTRGVLAHESIVVTVMTNLGFRLSMESHGIHVIETSVGDRHVLEALADGGYNLGGEQSGHIIFSDMATTGDGLLSAVQVLAAITRDGVSIGEAVARSMERLPQVLVNVPVSGDASTALTDVAADIVEVEQRLGADGRVLVRSSGTEPLIRVMAEARSAEAAQAAVDQIASALGDCRDR